MLVNEKRRQKINKFQPCRVERLSKMIKSMTLNLCDPDKISTSPDEVVNSMDNLNRMQRLSVGVYMYDRAASIATHAEQKDSSVSDSASSVDRSDEKDKEEDK